MLGCWLWWKEGPWAKDVGISRSWKRGELVLPRSLWRDQPCPHLDLVLWGLWPPGLRHSKHWGKKVKVKSLSCVRLCDPMDCSLPGSSVRGIFQARILEWVVISFFRRSSQPRDWTWVSHIVGRSFTIWAHWNKKLKPWIAGSAPMLGERWVWLLP